ncbi:hypothetical protein NIES2119_29210 [[Phormidium ambiguum] IAM M-71]|uniref:Uncharacterized protein n=1 Tax=[Phormidium ambiguum] IAM M-71 TaxID=454136 RepID=A0A1U7I4W8_9CYAN|nr:DUF6658 family protein [Phormidium ambiguum]OKH31289.1 hypothetical protein NIES2119_29210 [Phormidium ambiguum IAM M-71]
MGNLINFLKKVRIHRILTVLLAVTAILFTTACNSGNVTGARPNNPPVQAGGANNPHKNGGDGYTNFKASTDPRVNSQTVNKERNRADIQLISHQLIAGNIESDASDLLYPGVDATSSKNPDIGPRGERELEKSVTQIPAPRQGVINRNDPDAQILERVGETFKDASAFIKDKFEQPTEPELQVNPAKER